MKFVPKAPREGINVSKTHPLKEALTLLLGISVVLAVLTAIIAWHVDWLVSLIPPEAEARAFESFELDLAAENDADLEERRAKVQGLLDRLAAHWDDNPYRFRAVVLKSGDANAAALPGGHVLVTTALLDQVESENELAFVLGHELGHFHGRDHLRRLGRTVVYGLVLTAVVGTSGSSLPDLTTLSGDLTSRGFDRAQEADADHFGLALVHAEYGHVGSSWHFFERLATEELAVQALLAYLSTHPASSERRDDLRDYARGAGWPVEGDTRPF